MKKNKGVVDVVTLGCSKNLVDSEQLMRQFQAIGYEVRHDAPRPDGEIVIVNTCGFIGDAKEESINTILGLVANRKKLKTDKLFVMGCLSERYMNDLQREIPEVDKYYGKFNYTDILKDIGQEYRADLKLERKLTTPSHFAYLKISEGCNRTCSYCAIPLITGKHRSRSMNEIESEVQNLVKQGVKEFQFIAQDLSYYGIDKYKSQKLPELLERISDIPGVEWIRLHYAYPAHFPYDILRVMRERDNICNYLDIALQHISDPMLKLMRRNITREQTYDLIRRLRSDVPGIHLRTTMLVGHPGETQQDLEEIKEFLSFARFERMGAFAYSNEDSTFASENYQDDIPADEKQRRLNEIMLHQQQIATEISLSKIGQTHQVIIDRYDGEYFVGRTQFDSPEVDPEVLIAADCRDFKVGDFYYVDITGVSDYDLLGRIVE